MPKFEKGHPGGPGRPRGSRNAVNLMLDQVAEEGVAAVVRKVVAEAMEGDMQAARLVLGRTWTAPKGRPLQVELPAIDTPEDLLAAHAAVAAAVSDGRLTARRSRPCWRRTAAPLSWWRRKRRSTSSTSGCEATRKR